MALSLQQTDTVAVDGISAMCSGATLGSTTAARKASSGASAGSTATTVTLGANLVGRAVIAFESNVGEPNNTSWANGNYVVRCNITTALASLQWTETWVCRCNSAGVNQATVGSLTGQTTDCSTTGVKTHTVAGALQTAGATDRIYIVLVFQHVAAKGGSSFAFTPNQLIDTPVVAITFDPSAGFPWPLIAERYPPRPARLSLAAFQSNIRGADFTPVPVDPLLDGTTFPWIEPQRPRARQTLTAGEMQRSFDDPTVQTPINDAVILHAQSQQPRRGSVLSPAEMTTAHSDPTTVSAALQADTTIPWFAQVALRPAGKPSRVPVGYHRQNDFPQTDVFVQPSWMPSQFPRSASSQALRQSNNLRQGWEFQLGEPRPDYLTQEHWAAPVATVRQPVAHLLIAEQQAQAKMDLFIVDMGWQEQQQGPHKRPGPLPLGQQTFPDSFFGADDPKVVGAWRVDVCPRPPAARRGVVTTAELSAATTATVIDFHFRPVDWQRPTAARPGAPRIDASDPASFLAFVVDTTRPWAWSVQPQTPRRGPVREGVARPVEGQSVVDATQFWSLGLFPDVQQPVRYAARGRAGLGTAGDTCPPWAATVIVIGGPFYMTAGDMASGWMVAGQATPY